MLGRSYNFQLSWMKVVSLQRIVMYNKSSRVDGTLERLGDQLVIQKSLGNGIAIRNIERLIKFFERKKRRN
jgi:hypothetical protein